MAWIRLPISSSRLELLCIDASRSVAAYFFFFYAVEDGRPVLSGMTADEKCNSEFDMGMSWLSGTILAVVIVFIVLIVVSIVVILIVFIKPNKKKSESQKTRDLPV